MAEGAGGVHVLPSISPSSVLALVHRDEAEVTTRKKVRLIYL